MRVFKDTVEVHASPEQVWAWLFDFTGHYCEWHPAHRLAFWAKGPPNEIGSVLYTEEDLRGHVLKLSIKITTITPHHVIGFQTVGWLRLFVPRGSFEIDPVPTGCQVTATLVFRAGRILSRLGRKILEAVVQHMKEEGENLKKLIEKVT